MVLEAESEKHPALPLSPAGLRRRPPLRDREGKSGPHPGSAVVAEPAAARAPSAEGEIYVESFSAVRVVESENYKDVYTVNYDEER